MNPATPDGAVRDPSTALLRRLGAGAHRVVEGARPAGSALTDEDFTALLRRAERGEFSSGRRVEPGQDVRIELSEEQVRRISRAADGAEAAGATRLVALIDGMALAMDIPARRIDAALPQTGADDEPVPPREILRDVDAAVRLADTRAGESAEEEDGAEAPGVEATIAAALIGRMENDTLLDQLSRVPGPARSASTDGD